jgi:hypothetical protein
MHNSFWYDVASTERYEKLDPETVDKLLEDATSRASSANA